MKYTKFTVCMYSELSLSVNLQWEAAERCGENTTSTLQLTNNNWCTDKSFQVKLTQHGRQNRDSRLWTFCRFGRGFKNVIDNQRFHHNSHVSDPSIHLWYILLIKKKERRIIEYLELLSSEDNLSLILSLLNMDLDPKLNPTFAVRKEMNINSNTWCGKGWAGMHCSMFVAEGLWLQLL